MCSYVFLNEFIGQFIPIATLFVLRGVVWLGEQVSDFVDVTGGRVAV